MKFPLFKFISVLSIGLILSVPLAAQDFLPELVKRIKPSSVAIETFDARGNSVSRGSGFLVAADRVVTNRHVIERASRVEVHLVDGKKFPAKGILAIDGEGDLALLKVDLPPGLAAALPISRAVPQEGESIVVVGNPFGLEGSVSNGIVSAVREIAGYGKIIQITAPISPGSSGSPVVNMWGQVIGVATLQAAEGQSLNFAVPAERILQMRVTDLKTVASHAATAQRDKRAAAESAFSQGVVLLSRDDFARALPYFEKAVDADPNYAEAWYQAGYAYGFLGRHADALKASKQAAKLRPDWAEAHVNIGASNFALGQFKEAADAYRQAIRIEDDSADTQYGLGLSLEKLGRTDEEALAYRRALALNPGHSGAMERLGLAYVKLKRHADALAAFEQLKIYKPEAKTYNYIGESLFEQGKTEEASEAFNTAVNYNPDLDAARFNLGRAYVKLGNIAMARAQYEILRAARSDLADRLLVLIDP
ncbi:MAG: tetratricopeptide repeat protein [Chloracidobacterium sp.]|nr:tetratricopeptide repeat protein [Chloracidobacterium sp.]